jgi:hypothetical protein
MSGIIRSSASDIVATMNTPRTTEVPPNESENVLKTPGTTYVPDESENDLSDSLDSLSFTSTTSAEASTSEEEDLEAKFNSLNDETRSQLSKTSIYLDVLEDALSNKNKNNYILARQRRFLVIFLSSLENLEDRQKLINVLSLPTSKANHVPADVRGDILPLFQRWKKKILEKGQKPKNNFHLWNHSLNPLFQSYLASRTWIRFCPAMFMDGFEIYGDISEDEFKKDMENCGYGNFEEYGIIYSTQQIVAE